MSKLKKISIFGCGWLGKPLALELEKRYIVKGSVQSTSSYNKLRIKQKYILNLKNISDASSFFDTDILIIAIAPKKLYKEAISALLANIDKTTNIILLSSTSIYTQQEGEITEKDSHDIKNPSLMLEVERVLYKDLKNILILRLGGLMGYDRIAGKYSASKSLEHDSYANYIHRDDVIRVIEHLIKLNINRGVYNVVAPMHRSKKEIYAKNAKKFGFDKTDFISKEIRGKKVLSDKLCEELGYIFLKKDPLDFW